MDLGMLQLMLLDLLVMTCLPLSLQLFLVGSQLPLILCHLRLLPDFQVPCCGILRSVPKWGHIRVFHELDAEQARGVTTRRQNRGMGEIDVVCTIGTLWMCMEPMGVDGAVHAVHKCPAINIVPPTVFVGCA